MGGCPQEGRVCPRVGRAVTRNPNTPISGRDEDIEAASPVYSAPPHRPSYFIFGSAAAFARSGRWGAAPSPRDAGTRAPASSRPQVASRRRPTRGRGPGMGRRGAGSAPRALPPPSASGPASLTAEPAAASGPATRRRDTKTGSAPPWPSARDSPSPLRPAPRSRTANQRPGSSPPTARPLRPRIRRARTPGRGRGRRGGWADGRTGGRAGAP